MANRGLPETGEDVLTRSEPATRVPKLYRVILHNDDFTSMEFVVSILVRYFHKSEAEATRIMLQVHLAGRGTAGRYPRDQAETKVAQVTAEAEREGFPLLVTMEAD